MSQTDKQGPVSIDELFSRDPLALTDSNIDDIIAHYRSERAVWMVKENTPKKKSPKEKVALPDASYYLSLPAIETD